MKIYIGKGFTVEYKDEDGDEVGGFYYESRSEAITDIANQKRHGLKAIRFWMETRTGGVQLARL